MPFFTAWQLSPSPKALMRSQHPFQPGHRGLLAMGVLCCEPLQRRTEKKKRPYTLVWDSQGIQSSHRQQCRGVRASSESERSHGRFQPQMGRELDWEPSHGPWPSQPGQDRCSDKVAGGLLCGIEHHTAAHRFPDKNNLLGGSFHQSCTRKVDFRRIPDSQLKSMSKPHSWEPWWGGGVSLKPCWSY